MVRWKDRFLRLCAECLVDSESLACHALSSPEWDYLLDVASRHSIAPLLYHNLANSDQRVPPEVMEHLKKQYYLNTIRNEVLYRELGRILEAQRDAEVEVVVLKGAALAETVYPDRGLRPFSDIDLLIRKENLNRTEDTLTKLGYTLDAYATPRGFSKKFDYHLRYINGMSIVELHWDLSLRASIYKYTNIRPDALWRNARKSKVAGIDVLIPSPEDLIIHSCIHSAKHRYSKLIWLYDIRQIAERHPIDWKHLIRSAKSDRTARSVFYGLLFTDELLGPILPKYELNELRPPIPEIRLFTFFIRCDSFSIFNMAKDMVLRFLLIDRQIDRLRFLVTYPVVSLVYILLGRKKRTLRRIREGTVGL
ncbi:MAG: nucleotidyltransferase family protein [Candidatus Methanoperedens sp.]|nr:nucleotidyltransferase family protein [Candidatus Methanoperedens sp.]